LKKWSYTEIFWKLFHV